MQVVERPRVRASVIVLWLALVPFAMLTGLRLLGIDGPKPIIAAIALTPYATVCAVLLAALCLVLRHWRVGAAAVVVALALTSMVLPRAFANEQPAVSGPVLRVLASNLLAGEADPAEVVRLVRTQHVDVLNLVELPTSAVARLDQAGLGDVLPFRVVHPSRGAAGGGIFSRYPLTEVPLTRKQPMASLTVDGRSVEIIAAHPAAPMWEPGVWATEFADLLAAGPGLRIIAGDLNATLDHFKLRDLLATGYHDAANETGTGFDPTWPSAAFPPPVTIDHVLADQRIAVRAYQVFDMPGSDHRAVYAELALP
ncbi:endonuclease/exonuclease/phosphatase family protein [Amycolatopsis sp. cg5]|uniref:endonuclease/exonuclease/phosphatase family protein n=1 Tax=Amycolatopsis sp. cg5 TaxID=3238802 RepID=UPI003525D2BE